VRLVRRGGLLVVLWLLAWGELSLANVVSGVVLAAALLVAFPLGAAEGPSARAHALGTVRLVAYVASQLVMANLVMTRNIVRRTPRLSPGVVHHVLTEPSELTVTLMTSIISLSPGTMTVDVDDDASEIAVHFFSLEDRAAAAASLARLERLVTAAVGGTP
jgi:multicomponent Na+:H+ antiporter subunit E